MLSPALIVSGTLGRVPMPVLYLHPLHHYAV